MLKIINHIQDLDYAQIMCVYSESLRQRGKQDYPHMSTNLQELSAERDLYDYLCIFLKDQDSFCAVWECQGRYEAALRLERYFDGYIITALETAPTARRKGCAKSLLKSIQGWISDRGINKLYSHIEKQNKASFALHSSCGFRQTLDYAVYVDGSVLWNSCTLCYEIE